MSDSIKHIFGGTRQQIIDVFSCYLQIVRMAVLGYQKFFEKISFCFPVNRLLYAHFIDGRNDTNPFDIKAWLLKRQKKSADLVAIINRIMKLLGITHFG